MDRNELENLFGEIQRTPDATVEQFEGLAQSVVEAFVGDSSFRQHIKNRSGRVTSSTGQAFDAEKFDLAMARAFIADEVGFSSWDDLIDTIKDPARSRYPILFQYATAALWRGDFTSLERAIGSNFFDDQIKDWFHAGYFTDEPETFAEAFAAACWLGHADAAAFLLDNGVDPYAGMRTGLSGFHWAASSGQPAVIKLLIERKVPMEIKSMYDSTVLGQALWSAVNEHTDGHAEIIAALIAAGAHVWPDTLEWWNEQPVPSPETKQRVAAALTRSLRA